MGTLPTWSSATETGNQATRCDGELVQLAGLRWHTGQADTNKHQVKRQQERLSFTTGLFADEDHVDRNWFLSIACWPGPAVPLLNRSHRMLDWRRWQTREVE